MKENFVSRNTTSSEVLTWVGKKMSVKMSQFCFECFHRSTIKTKAISVRYPVTSPTCQLTDHQLADTIGQNADILIDIIWTNRLATFRECIELISVVIKSLKVSASWRVGEVTLHLTDKKKNHLPMEGPMLGFSACVYHSRFITPLHVKVSEVTFHCVNTSHLSMFA